MLAGTLENLFINGDFLPGLWRSEEVECAVGRHTFAAARWKVRYARPEGAPITQARSADGSLELRGAPGVTQPVLLGQRIEAAEAVRYRGELVFSAWVQATGSEAAHGDLELVCESAGEADDFGAVKTEFKTCLEAVPTGRWVQIERAIDARAFQPTGLSVELEFPARLLHRADSRIRVKGMRLAHASAAQRTVARPASMEDQLARRFYQRHDSSTVNAIGRALVVNAHELHFQFTFPEMRAFPACTLPHPEDGFRVFSLEGIPQEGFTYDVPYRSRGSAIIRATKAQHGLADGYLPFVASSAALLLDAEL